MRVICGSIFRPITERVEHVKAQGQDGDLEAAGKGSVARSDLEAGHQRSGYRVRK
jgi:hypothetical protein